jgi:hypothetical protein
MVYSVEKLNSLVSAARIDLEAFKSREHHHRESKLVQIRSLRCFSVVSH